MSEESLLNEEILRLRTELDEAYALIESKESDLQLSATYGRRLIEDNAELSRRIDCQSTDFSKKIEVPRISDALTSQSLQQENHELKMKLSADTMTKVDRNTYADGQLVLSELEKENAALKEDLERRQKKLDTLSKDHSRCEALLEAQVLIHAHSDHRVEHIVNSSKMSSERANACVLAWQQPRLLLELGYSYPSPLIPAPYWTRIGHRLYEAAHRRT
jgi:hypothetical protein